jgi:hypothetical protein
VRVCLLVRVWQTNWHFSILVCAHARRRSFKVPRSCACLRLFACPTCACVLIPASFHFAEGGCGRSVPLSIPLVDGRAGGEQPLQATRHRRATLVAGERRRASTAARSPFTAASCSSPPEALAAAGVAPRAAAASRAGSAEACWHTRHALRCALRGLDATAAAARRCAHGTPGGCRQPSA